MKAVLSVLLFIAIATAIISAGFGVGYAIDNRIKATSRFQPGDMVEFKGMGVRSLVERVHCNALECVYDLRLNYGPRESRVPEVVLELVPQRRKS